MQRIISMDLHTHLLEKKINANKWWNSVSAKKLDVVAITEHFNFKPKAAFQKLSALKPHNVVLLPGMELETSAGHALVYGIDNSIYDVEDFFVKGIDFFKAVDLAERNGFLLSIAHPWGFEDDSAAYLFNGKLDDLIESRNVGVEVYNGLVGKVGDFVYSSNWVNKPINFFDFLEKNRIAKTLKLSKFGGKIEHGLERRVRDLMERNVKAYELGRKASFVTAGSDAHSAEAIGSGILKLKFSKESSAENVFNALRHKRNVVWSGPFLNEISPGKFEVSRQGVKKMEFLQGLRYAATKKVKKSVGDRIVRKIGKKALIEKIKRIGKKLKMKKKSD